MWMAVSLTEIFEIVQEGNISSGLESEGDDISLLAHSGSRIRTNLG